MLYPRKHIIHRLGLTKTNNNNQILKNMNLYRLQLNPPTWVEAESSINAIELALLEKPESFKGIAGLGITVIYPNSDNDSIIQYESYLKDGVSGEYIRKEMETERPRIIREDNIQFPELEIKDFDLDIQDALQYTLVDSIMHKQGSQHPSQTELYNEIADGIEIPNISSPLSNRASNRVSIEVNFMVRPTNLVAYKAISKYIKNRG